MKRFSIAVLTVCSTAAFVSGCAQQRSTNSPSTSDNSGGGYVTHIYKVSAKDINGQPLEGAQALFNLKANANQAEPQICTTDKAGECSIHIHVQSSSVSSYSTSYRSSASVTLKKEGFLNGSGYGSLDYGTSYGSDKAPTKDVSSTLLRPSDYLLDGFGANAAERDLRDQALKFLSLIRMQSYLVDASVMTKSIGLSTFKGNKYFTMKINSDNSYNSLKLNKYQIGRTLFDDSIRAILTPLNDNMTNQRNFYGYDLIVYGYTKDFSEKYAAPTKLEYRFLMPQEAVRRYKNKDISGQQLIDQSVVLLDDERIDLKLQ